MTTITLQAQKGTKGKRADLMSVDLHAVTIDTAQGTTTTLAFGTTETDVHDERTGERSGTLTVADARRVLPLDGASALLGEGFALSVQVSGAKGTPRRVALPVKYARRNGRPYAEGSATIAHGGQKWNVTVSVRVSEKRTGDEVSLTVRAKVATSDAAQVQAPRVALQDLFA